jgi:cbb3-type cytochrome oxidase subunit 1
LSEQVRGSAQYQVEPDFAARQSILWAIAWLVGGVTVTLALHVLLVRPDLNAGLGFLTYGRLRAVADTTIVFGWLGTIAFAAIFGLVPRIAEVQLHNEPLGAATTLTWSLILTGGIVAVLLGLDQGRPLAELPAGADLGIALMLVMVLYNAGVTVVRRRERTLYVSGWFLLAAALLGPLVFIMGNLPVLSGVTDAIVSGFYQNGIEVLWLLPVALGIAHYVVPVETGNGLYSSVLARTTFWSLMFAGGWCGQRFFLKGPAPDYLDAIAVAMTFVLLIPILSAAANLYASGKDRWNLASQAFGLRFAASGLGLAVAWIVLVVITVTPSFNRFVGVTAWASGVRHLAVFGVFSSFGFAFVYHAYPLMVGRDWYSKRLASLHFWGTNVGVIAGVVFLLATGAAQGATTGLTGASPAAAGAFTGPDVVVVLRMLTGLAFAVVAVAQYALAYNAMRTARAGPYLQVLTQPAMAQASR